jgi:hypothetical protein
VEPERKRGSGVVFVGTRFEGVGVRLGAGLTYGAKGLAAGERTAGPANGAMGFVGPAGERRSGVAFTGKWFEGVGARLGAGLTYGAKELAAGVPAAGPANCVMGFVGPAGERGSDVAFTGIWFVGLGAGLGAGLMSGAIG